MALCGMHSRGTNASERTAEMSTLVQKDGEHHNGVLQKMRSIQKPIYVIICIVVIIVSPVIGRGLRVGVVCARE